MSNTRKHQRRIFGGVCLGGAMLLLILGQTVLKAWLAEALLVMLGYWLVCFILAAAAALVAIVDAARVRQETRAEQRALLESTLREIEREKQERESSRT